MADVTPVAPGRSAQGKADASAKRRAEDAADASLLRDRVTAAFGEQYLIGEEVGRGGMAVVYAAEDVRLQRQVALKVLPPDLAFRSDVRERFVREAQTAARLNHPHIVPIYAVHEKSGVVCFAMALVTGESLAAFVARTARSGFDTIAGILEQVADALAYAHASGVVHRDIKPDNILLDRDSGRAMVTDFGIARAAESGARLTQTGIAVGTPAFMSPEQATGEKEVDGRSDVYSLGVVGYLMLAGRLPFDAASTPAMLLAHVSETPKPIWSIRPDAPRSLVEILEKALAKRPADRWESAQAMRDALRRVQRDGSLGVAPEPYRGPAPQSAREAQLRNLERDQQEAERVARARRDYADRHGHRAEDWNPRSLAAAEPAGMHPVAPMPALPPLSPSASREEFREWRRAVKEQRREVNRRWKMERDANKEAMEYGGGSALGVGVARPLDQQIARFRWRVVSTAGTMVFLGMINAATSRQFPWAIFPIFGMSMGLLAQWGRLRSQGARWSQIFSNGDEEAALALAAPPQSKPRKIAEAVFSFRRRLKWVAGSVAVAAASFAIGAGFGIDPMQIPFAASIVAGLISTQLSLVAGVRLRRLGVPVSAALGSDWRDLATVPDDRPRDLILRDELDRIAGPTVMSSPYGDVLRSAVDDRVTIRELSAKLSDADKSLVPDVEPTADALMERIGALATGLERLHRDLPVDALTQLESRIAAVSAESEDAPDHERRLALLTRQRDSLQELVDRRETMQRQLESASLAMRSLRFDMVKLRTLGVGAAIGDVTSATQEARALSREIGHAVDAANELRRL